MHLQHLLYQKKRLIRGSECTLIWKTHADVIMDLRSLHSGQGTKYDVFWNECEKFLQENIGLAVEERRHSAVTHLARVVSVRDLLQQVTARCPESTPIPSRSWLSLQFWPKNVHAQSRIHYTGRFKVKYMVQARQFRKDHEDAHYAAAIFRYQRECAGNIAFSFVWMINTELKSGNLTIQLLLLKGGGESLCGKMNHFKSLITISPNLV